MRDTSYKEIDVRLAESLYLQGKSLRQVAAIFGVSASLIQKRLERLGVNRRPEGYQRPTSVRPPTTGAKSLPRYRMQHRAHRMVEAAIKAGQIQQLDRCETCLKPDVPLHAHHADYNKPLSVEWLCNSCHRKWHAQYKPIYPSGPLTWEVNSKRGRPRGQRRQTV